jgi:hypothetical protein
MGESGVGTFVLTLSQPIPWHQGNHARFNIQADSMDKALERQCGTKKEQNRWGSQ